jgi:hypothetical protein
MGGMQSFCRAGAVADSSNHVPAACLLLLLLLLLLSGCGRSTDILYTG